jgi:hypothetical protein
MEDLELSLRVAGDRTELPNSESIPHDDAPLHQATERGVVDEN